jgi:rhodanese-related sulfurtransferase
LVDVRSPGEYKGELLHMADYPQEGSRCVAGTFPAPRAFPGHGPPTKTAPSAVPTELRAIYEEEQGLTPDDDVVAYCRIGERSSHTWFVLTYLLGYELCATTTVPGPNGATQLDCRLNGREDWGMVKVGFSCVPIPIPVCRFTSMNERDRMSELSQHLIVLTRFGQFPILNVKSMGIACLSGQRRQQSEAQGGS